MTRKSEVARTVILVILLLAEIAYMLYISRATNSL